jgi:hypothetical protein
MIRFLLLGGEYVLVKFQSNKLNGTCGVFWTHEALVTAFIQVFVQPWLSMPTCLPYVRPK